MLEIHLIVDGKAVTVPLGATILEAAKRAGIEIPTLCHDARVEPYGACGLCVVEQEGNPKLLRACASKAADGMVIDTKSERVRASRQFALSLLLSDHLGDCIAPCSLACPAGTDCQGYVGLIANGEYAAAARLIREKIPFPASIGRICPHPCETACRRKHVEQPISIAALKSVAGDFDLEQGLTLPEMLPESGKRIAIIGGGPGGLTAAYFLRRKGHAVTVYDAMPQMGGMLRYGIPEYRLPKAVLQAEIDLLAKMGIVLHNNVRIGEAVTLDTLRTEHDAVVVAVGAWRSGNMRVPGEDLPGVIGGIDFLRAVSLGETPAIGERVAVCGGGNTAMDACRTAVRLGAKEVYILYRRTREEMPAEDLEMEEAEQEGVVFRYLVNPTEIYGDGKVQGVKLQQMRLGEPDASGRRRPEPVEGAFADLPLDSVIMAIGQSPDLTGLEALEATKWRTVLADESTFRTNLPDVFAVGDATNNGADIAITAIGEAQKAANVIDSFLAGQEIPYRKPLISEREVSPEEYQDREKQARAEQKVLPGAMRKQNFLPFAETLPLDAAAREGARCLECGCLDYHECKLISYARDYEADPKPYGVSREKHGVDESHPYLTHEFDKCVLCGLCVRVCGEVMGVTALGMSGRGFPTVVSPEFGKGLADSACVSCGQCVALCPTGALQEKVPFKKSVPLKEERVRTICPGCAVGCEMELARVGKTVTKAVPCGKTLACAEGRFGFGLVNDPQRVTTPLLDSKPCSWEQAIAALQTALQQNNVAILLAESLPREAIDAALALKKPSYRFFPERRALQGTKAFDTAVLGEGFHTGANAAYLAEKGVPPLGDAEIVKTEQFLVIGADAPGNIPQEKLLCVVGYSAQGKLFFPAAQYAETEGTLANGKQMRRAFAPASGRNTIEILQECGKKA